MTHYHTLVVRLCAVLSATSPLTAQTAWAARPGPLYRYGIVATYDSARERVVAFGGETPSRRRLTDTLEWDRTQWVVRSTVNSPPNQQGHAMSYDAARGRTVLVGAGGTWLWDGLDWLRSSSTPEPAERTNHALSYDPVRRVTVLFGGRVGGVSTDETWEWDGQGWSRLNPAVRPPAMSFHQMAWDPINQRTLLFHGVTWTWDGTTWTRLNPTFPPEAGVQLATDLVRRRIVAVKSGATGYVAEWDGSQWGGTLNTLPPFLTEYPTLAALAYEGNGRVLLTAPGGYSHRYDGTSWTFVRYDSAAGGVLATDTRRQRVVSLSGRTWEWNANNSEFTLEWHDGAWNFVRSTRHPNARWGYSLAFDTRRARTMLFGGSNNSSALDELWEWDGGDWTLRSSTSRPPARDNAALAYDTARGELLLFGGSNFTSYRNDTWKWDGQSWMQAFPRTVPQVNETPVAAYDESRSRIVMVGQAGTWEWDGTDWTQRAPGNSPPGLGSIAYDARRSRIVVARTNGLSGTELWSWDGLAWRLEPLSALSLRVSRALAYDAERGRLLLVDSESATWAEVGTPASALPYGAGCAGERGVPTLAARGLPVVPNATFRLELAFGRPSAPAAIVLAANATAIGFGPCTVLVDSVLLTVPLVINATGFAELNLPIPNAASFLGLALRTQGVVADPQGAFAGVLALTQALELRLGH